MNPKSGQSLKDILTGFFELAEQETLSAEQARKLKFAILRIPGQPDEFTKAVYDLLENFKPDTTGAEIKALLSRDLDAQPAAPKPPRKPKDGGLVAMC